MHAETPPPYRNISSQPISLAEASEILSTYLSNSESHPHLHPDALITPTGVTFSSHGGPSGGVVMHNLRRVAAGLRGDYLEPEATPEPEDQEEQDASAARKKGKKSRKGGDAVEAVAAEEWQSMSEWEREEGAIAVGEVGPRSNFVQEGGEPPEVEVVEDAEIEEAGKKRKKGGEGKADKEARKKAKKARRKAEQVEKERARSKKAE